MATANNSIKCHFASLYSPQAQSFARALQALLPAELATPTVLGLESTAFLTDAVVRRWREACAGAAAQAHRNCSQLRLVDLGCGRGHLGVALGEPLGAEVLGVDIAHEAFRAIPKAACPRTHLVNADLCALPLAQHSCHLAIAIDSLYLIDDVQLALREIRRVLVPGSWLIGSLYRVSGTFRGPRSQTWWHAALAQTGFTLVRWDDVTNEWRSQMTEKHSRIWHYRHTLVKIFGCIAYAQCEVSKRMLGLDLGLGFIATNERWEFVAASL